MRGFPHLEPNTKRGLGLVSRFTHFSILKVCDHSLNNFSHSLKISEILHYIHRPARYLWNSQIFVVLGQIFTENDNNTSLLHVQIRALRVALYKSTARGDFVAHEHVEDFVGFYGFFDADLQDCAVLRVHGGVPQRVRVHLAQTFVAAYFWLFAIVGGFVFLDQPVAFLFGVDVVDGFAHLDVEERGLRDKEMAVGDERLHIAVEEGQQQRADMRPVNVGVAHDYDATVAQFGDVEVFVDARADGRDDVLDFLVFQDFVQSHALYVEDFTAQGQDGLEVAVASLLCATTSRIA